MTVLDIVSKHQEYVWVFFLKNFFFISVHEREYLQERVTAEMKIKTEEEGGLTCDRGGEADWKMHPSSEAGSPEVNHLSWIFL